MKETDCLGFAGEMRMTSNNKTNNFFVPYFCNLISFILKTVNKIVHPGASAKLFLK
jgi:hypothetical protein